MPDPSTLASSSSTTGLPIGQGGEHPLSPGRTTSFRSTYGLSASRRNTMIQDDDEICTALPTASYFDPARQKACTISSGTPSASSSRSIGLNSAANLPSPSSTLKPSHPSLDRARPSASNSNLPLSSPSSSKPCSDTASHPAVSTNDVNPPANTSSISNLSRLPSLTAYEEGVLQARYDLMTEGQLVDALRPWSNLELAAGPAGDDHGREPLFPDDSPSGSSFPELRKEHPLRVLARLAWIMWDREKERVPLGNGDRSSSAMGKVKGKGKERVAANGHVVSQNLSFDLHDALSSSLSTPLSTLPRSSPPLADLEPSIKSRNRSTSTLSSLVSSATDPLLEPSLATTSSVPTRGKQHERGQGAIEGKDSLRDRSRSIGERSGETWREGDKLSPKERASVGSWIGIGKSGLFGWGNRKPSTSPSYPEVNPSSSLPCLSSHDGSTPTTLTISPSIMNTSLPVSSTTPLDQPPPIPSPPATTPDKDHGIDRPPPTSSPSHFKAIFLSTRLLSSDPSSLFSDPSLAAPLVRKLAFELVTNARKDHISLREERSRPVRKLPASEIIPIDAPRSSLKVDAIPAPSSTSPPPARPAFANPSSGTSSVLSRLLLGTSAPRHQPHSTRHSHTTSLSRASSTLPAASPMRAPLIRSVELEPIEPVETKPPTVQLSRSNLEDLFNSSNTRKKKTASRFRAGGRRPLTDRYGFIYDVANIEMLREASEVGNPAPSQFAGLAKTSRNGLVDLEHDEAEEEDDLVNILPIDLPGLVSPSSAPHSHHVVLNHQQSPQTSRSPSKSPAHSPPDASSPSSIKDRELPSFAVRPTSPRSTSSSSKSKTKTRRRRSSTIVSIEPSPVQPTIASVQPLHASAQEPSLDPFPPPRSPLPAPNVLPLPRSNRSTFVATPFHNALPPSSSSSFASSAIGKQRTIEILLNSLVSTHAKLDEARLASWKVFLRAREKERALSSSSSRYQDDAPSFLGFDTMSTSNPDTYRSFLALVRKGIPVLYRSKAWAECSGATTLVVPGVYEELLSKAMKEGLKSTVVAEIEKDIVRTLPSNSFFGGDGPGVVKLRNILYATAWRELATGYCQGLNMIAATLLLIHPEAEAYWVLTAIMSSSRLCPPDYYSSDLSGSRTDQAVLVDLVALELPSLAAHLEELGAELPAISFSWFLSLFTDCLPVETLFRLWDVFFVEGFDLWFRIALAILKLHEATLLETESVGDLYTSISECTSRLWSPDLLLSIESTLQSTITSHLISSRRAFHVARMQETKTRAFDDS